MEEKERGYLIGIIGALIGGLIATIPWILCYVYANMIYSLLAIIVAIASLTNVSLANPTNSDLSALLFHSLILD